MPSRQHATVAPPAHAARVQSPSSINTWKQCPRKYYYQYLAGLPSKPSIHLLRGNLTHLALDRFFDTEITNVPDGEAFFFTMKIVLLETFRKAWGEHHDELAALGLSEERLLGYYDETRDMLGNYFEYFTGKMRYLTGLMPVKEAWEAVKPNRELALVSEQHGVRGFLDAIHDEKGKTVILDYKTSRRAGLTPEYALQLGIYALLYEEQFRTPDMVGLYFLKEGKEVLLNVTPAMIEHAKREVFEVHLGTQSKEMKDYAKKPGPLCKYATGQCDFYEYCWEGKELPGK
jgi:CRISPR/Cas system-associated exonuclease Cas4 (RecB family)